MKIYEDVEMPEGFTFIPYSRKNSEYEISVSLFEKCNLRCSFCFCSHKKDVEEPNVDKIVNLPYVIKDQLINDLKKYPCIKVLNIRTWGGELFADNIPDSLFDAYRQYCKNFKDALSELNITIKFHWLSNGIFTKINRVRDLLNDTEATLSFSYDSVGRFPSEHHKKLWRNNVMIFEKYKNSISLTLTRPNIKAFPTDTYINSIPETYHIDANYYWPNENWESLLPSEDDLAEFFVHCIKNKKYNIDLISPLVMSGLGIKVAPYCNCLFTAQIINNKLTKDCVRRTSVLDPNLFYANRADEVNENNCTAVKNYLSLTKRKCLLCPLYNQCPGGCMGAMLFANYKVNDSLSNKCPFKLAIDYVKNNKEDIIPSFTKWQELMCKSL